MFTHPHQGLVACLAAVDLYRHIAQELLKQHVVFYLDTYALVCLSTGNITRNINAYACYMVSEHAKSKASILV